LDRFVRGFIIGVATSAVKDVLSYISYYVLHFTKATYGHLMAVYLLGRSPRTTFELIFSQIAELGIEGAVGVVFIYYAYRTKNKKNLWLKGIFFAFAVYFLTYVFGTFFRLPLIGRPAIETAVSNFITTAIFGVLMGAVTYWWGKRIGDFSAEVETVHYALEEDTEDDEKVKLRKPIKLK
jgi:Zn-dependent protease with chaperone function